jgi:thioredoxin-dependent peroxiredoxin
MLAVGDTAPDFAVPQPDGSTRSLSDYRGRAVILFFFPKANTGGCTLETRGFVERYDAFQSAGFEVVGVSIDTPETQGRFAAKCGSRFPIVGDPHKEITGAYGVLGIWGVAKRVTFLIDGEGRIREMAEGLLPFPHLAAADRWVGRVAPSERPR